MNKMKDGFFEDYDSGDVSDSKSDYYDSQRLLAEMSMKRYGITENDMQNLSVVKAKIRDSNIDGLLR